MYDWRGVVASGPAVVQLYCHREVYVRRTLEWQQRLHHYPFADVQVCRNFHLAALRDVLNVKPKP